MKLNKDNLHVLIDKTIYLLEQETYSNLDSNRGDKFDKLLAETLKHAAEALKIKNVDIELISGQRFPDIVLILNDGNSKIGIEAKTTKTKQWVANGGSIFESTKVKDVEDILIFFAKFYDGKVDFKYKWMEDCVSDVVFTHKPRFKINMEIDKTFFENAKITYQQMKEDSNPFSLIRDYLIARNSKSNSPVELWWVDESDGDDVEEEGPQFLRIIRDLSPNERNNICAELLILFPEILSSQQKKYSKCALFLASQKGLIDPSLRDNFSTNKVKNPLYDTSISGTFSTDSKGAYTYEQNLIPNYFRKILGVDYAKLIKSNINKVSTKYLESYWEDFDHNKSVLEQWLDKVYAIVRTNKDNSLKKLKEKKNIDIQEIIIAEIRNTYQ